MWEEGKVKGAGKTDTQPLGQAKLVELIFKLILWTSINYRPVKIKQDWECKGRKGRPNNS